MNRIDALNRRYAFTAALVRDGVEVDAIGDPAGALLDLAVRRLLRLFANDGGGYLDDLVGAAKALRWRRITQPQPTRYNPGLVDLSVEVVERAARLRGALADQALLDELEVAASLVAETDSAVGEALLRSILEVGVDSCVVVAESRPRAAGLSSWLGPVGVLVQTPRDLERDPAWRDVALVVGPPRYLRPSLVTAPIAKDVRFLVPAWFGDRSIPRSAIASYAEGAIEIEARVVIKGDVREPEPPTGVEEDEDALLPQPVWDSVRDADREPTSEEVAARKVLLSGDLAIWLDDGDWIRTLDLGQPAGERITHTDVAAVQQGTYLLLRRGETERHALYQAALARVSRGREVDDSQRLWKDRLAERIQRAGRRSVADQLRAAGVVAADQARAWTDPNLIRPNSDEDFTRLLNWLGIPAQPTFGYATMLRKERALASAEIRRQLEDAVSAADLWLLETSGHQSLGVAAEGFRGILATRVLAVSPYTSIVPRHEARVPFPDRSGRWLG